MFRLGTLGPISATFLLEELPAFALDLQAALAGPYMSHAPVAAAAHTTKRLKLSRLHVLGVPRVRLVHLFTLPSFSDRAPRAALRSCNNATGTDADGSACAS